MDPPSLVTDPAGAGRPGTAGVGAGVQQGSTQHHSSGMRLHAARLKASAFCVGAIASQWEVNDSTYRAIEKGRRPLRGTVLDLASERFEVSVGYLLDGVPAARADFEAGELLLRIARFSIHGFAVQPGDVASRLVGLRRTRGFASASAAATAMDWNSGRYGDHEGRRRNIPFDQAVRYGIAFGGLLALDYLIFADGSPAFAH